MLLSGDISSRIEDTSYTIVDSFEDGDISEYSGDTGNYDVIQDSSEAKHGDYYIEQTESSFSSIKSNSGLPTYPEQGDEWRVWLRVDDIGASNSYSGHYFATGNSDEYWVRIRAGTNEFDLDLHNGGQFTNSVTISLDTWYEVRIQWDDGSTFGGSAGDVRATLYDESGSELSEHFENDTEFTSGGIGMFGANAVKQDFIRITN